jgi:FlaG/FlaF family flagellin (archaellin)
MTMQKRGVSEMIGYILLISFAIVISGVVYIWMRLYVPQEQLQCPDDVSLMLKNYTCNNSILTLNIKNNGRFTVDGIFINARNDPALKIATKDISNYTKDSTSIYLGSGVIKFSSFTKFSNLTNTYPLEPNQERQLVFDLSSSGLGTIYSIDFNPIRWQEENNKLKMVNCGNAKVTEQLVGCTVSG